MATNHHHQECYLGKQMDFPRMDCRQCELLDHKDSCQETISNLEAAQKRLQTTIHELEKECDRLERLYSNGV